MATITFLRGIIVQRQTLGLPAGLTVSDPDCRENPQDCCESGASAAGCCWPRPPATLYAALYDPSEDCACLNACLTLTYNELADAWYSESLDGCGADPAPTLRLKCVLGAYRLDVVGDDDVILVEGVASALFDPSCDPFLAAFDFSDDGPHACGGTYSYLISESDCAGGGTIATDCCPDDLLPAVLTATLAGGNCPGEYVLVYGAHSTADGWAAELCPVAGPIGSLRCVGGAWRWADDGGDVGADSYDCAARTWTFTASSPGLGDYVVTVTG